MDRVLFVLLLMNFVGIGVYVTFFYIKIVIISNETSHAIDTQGQC